MEKRVDRGPFGDLPGCLRFFWAGVVAKRLQTGGVVPSQRFLISKMIAPVPPGYEGRIIELGCGTGALTLRLAARCPAARILACELNPALAEHSQRRVAMAGLHSRVKVVSDSAEHVLETAIQGAWSKPDYIISGIPLGNLRAKHVVALVTAVRQALAEGGMYIQFQHSLIDQKKIRACFHSLRTVPVFLNFPPAVVYYASVASRQFVS
jgi:phospholipid N-methyltransferase